MMDVILAVVGFFEVGEVAIELGGAFDDGIRAIAQPLAILREQIALVEEVADARGVAEDVRAVAEDAVGLRRDDVMAMLPMTVGLKIPTGVVAVFCFRPPLKLCRALFIGFSYEHQILQLLSDV